MKFCIESFLPQGCYSPALPSSTNICPSGCSMENFLTASTILLLLPLIVIIIIIIIIIEMIIMMVKMIFLLLKSPLPRMATLTL